MGNKIVADSGLVAKCGLYCGACKLYLKKKCNGCTENTKASWCKLRLCCMQNEFKTCADCKKHENPLECRKFNSFMSKIFSFIFKSDRVACINQIKKIGLSGHAEKMAELKLPSIKKNK